MPPFLVGHVQNAAPVATRDGYAYPSDLRRQIGVEERCLGAGRRERRFQASVGRYVGAEAAAPGGVRHRPGLRPRGRPALWPAFEGLRSCAGATAARHKAAVDFSLSPLMSLQATEETLLES